MDNKEPWEDYPCEECSESRFNEGHIVEALETLDLIAELIERRLSCHPAIVKRELTGEMQKAAGILYDSYQKVGELEA